jgi:hypothetical protein
MGAGGDHAVCGDTEGKCSETRAKAMEVHGLSLKE